MSYAAFLLVAIFISACLGIRNRVFRRPVMVIDQQRKDWITRSVLLVGGAGICAQAQAQWGWIGVVAFIALTVVAIWFSPHWSWGRQRNVFPGRSGT